MLLWLWHRLAAETLIRPLELPYATGTSIKIKQICLDVNLKSFTLLVFVCFNGFMTLLVNRRELTISSISQIRTHLSIKNII